VSHDWSKEMIRDLFAGRLSEEESREIHRHKDENRFQKVIEIEQERLGWAEPILVCLQEHLYVVQTGHGRVVRCECGHEFGDYRHNWKCNALVYQHTPEAGEVYVGPRAASSDWHVLREFYCPGCGSQLDVEAVPRGYPFIFNFLPDLGDE